ELNYKVDKNASNLRNQQSGTLALLFFEDPTLDDSLINPFFLSMLGSLTRACAVQGYDLLISFQQLSSNWHVEFEDSKKADGLILLGYGDYLEYVSRLELLVEQGTHFVRWGVVLPGQPGVTIGCDNFQGGRDMTQHLLEQGRRNIAFVGHASEHYPEFLERYKGYSNSLRNAGLPGLSVRPELQIDAFTTERSGFDAVNTLIARGVSFDALFCASDLIAIGGMRALADRGMRVPQDVAVAGFDDIPIASFTNPSLTTVQQDTKTAATLLVESLLALIHDEPVQSHTIPAKLAIRQSTEAVSRGRSI
ncbi:MAG TPA: substrate-binding domain-containing protein, partial [Steroidobacter sp.]|nr:substrate-binding domain-containing protein [Steroidobacter sp.]